jgi:hypothetical protein
MSRRPPGSSAPFRRPANFFAGAEQFLVLSAKSFAGFAAKSFAEFAEQFIVSWLALIFERSSSSDHLRAIIFERSSSSDHVSQIIRRTYRQHTGHHG